MAHKILYIMGLARSGTSFLSVILGNQPGMLNLGELNRFPSRKGIPPKRDLSSWDFGPFWEDFRKEIIKAPEFPGDWERLEDLTDYFEFHSWMVREFFFKKNREKYHLYINFLKRSMDLLMEKINTYYDGEKEDFLIDSSKYPSRALHLSKLYGDKASYIYLQRDPGNIVRSFQRKSLEQPSKNPISANIYLLSVNFLCEIAYNRLKENHNAIRIKYEDLIASPVQTLSSIEKKLGIDLSNSKEKIMQKTPLNTGPMFDGNRIRLKDQVTLKNDITWKKGILPFLSRLLNSPFYR